MNTENHSIQHIDNMSQVVRYVIALIGFILSAFLIIYYAERVQGARFVSEWLAHQFFFNYQDLGFIRRGLPGSVLYFFPEILTVNGIKILSIVMAGICTGLFWFYFLSATKRISVSNQLLLALCAVATPGMFMHIGYDLGRYDWIGLSLFIISIFAIEKNKHILLIPLCGIAICTHEAYFLIFFPCVLGILLIKNNSQSLFDIPWVRILSIAVPMLALYVLLAVKGDTEFENGESIRQHLTLYNHSFKSIGLTWGYDDPFDVLIRDFRENWNLVVEYLGPHGIIPKKYLLIAFVWVAFYIVIFGIFLRANNIKLSIWHVTACSPVFLMLIAVDYARFCALTSITVFIMFLYLAKHSERKIKIPFIPALCVSATGLLGPIGEIWMFPHTITPGF